jgi:hypothetical protein
VSVVLQRLAIKKIYFLRGEGGKKVILHGSRSRQMVSSFIINSFSSSEKKAISLL